MSIYAFSATNPERRPSLKGAVMVDVSMGKERVRSWPRPRGANQPQNVIDNQALFRNYSWAIKYLAPDMMAQIYDARVGMPLLPRDIAMMMLSGTLLWFTIPEGKAIYSMAALQAVSQSLDVFTQYQGMTLVRGEKFWEAKPFTPAGQPWWWQPPDMTSWTDVSGDALKLIATFDADTGCSINANNIVAVPRLRAKYTGIPNPTAAWTLNFNMKAMMANNNFRACGLFFQRSANGRILTVTRNQVEPLFVAYWPNLTSNPAASLSPNIVAWADSDFWQVSYSGGVIAFSMSPDGVIWKNRWNDLVSAYLGGPPDRMGVCAFYNTTAGFETAFNVGRWQFLQ